MDYGASVAPIVPVDCCIPVLLEPGIIAVDRQIRIDAEYKEEDVRWRGLLRLDTRKKGERIMQTTPPGKSRRGWRWLFLIPFVAVLWPPLYAGSTPTLAGFPFFYWYLILWIVLTGLLSALLYLLRV